MKTTNHDTNTHIKIPKKVDIKVQENWSSDDRLLSLSKGRQQTIVIRTPDQRDYFKDVDEVWKPVHEAVCGR